jgi:hypothetical protein
MSGITFSPRSNLWIINWLGHHIGRFVEDEVYGVDGQYLGELGSEDRLITRQRKLGRRKSSFRPRMVRMARMQRMGRMARMMRMGCEDFPSPEEL